MEHVQEAGKSSVQSIQRVFNILELLASDPQGFTLTEISQKLELHKSTSHRLLSELMSRGYVERDTDTGRFRLGLAFLHMSSMYLNRVELKSEAEYYLRDLANTLGQVVYLAIRQGDEVAYIDKIEKYDSLHRFAIIGQRRPLYCTSIGKALLLNETEHELLKLFGSAQRVKRTAKTMTEIPLLMEQMRIFRSKGWTHDNEEWEEGIKCIGAPIFDYRGRISAAISTVWNCRQKEVDVEACGEAVRRTALDISARLGHTVI